jgi:hypothetical protein
MAQITSLPIAVRPFPEPPEALATKQQQGKVRDKRWRQPEAMLVFDTETRIDATQRLTFGSYRFFVGEECQEEGLFHGTDLPEDDLEILRQYVSTHSAEAANKQLTLLTLQQFLGKFYKAVYQGRCLLVSFNFPFDLSRLARNFSPARGRFAGGFSFGLWSYVDQSGSERDNKFRPRVAIKHIDSKRSLKGFTARNACDPCDLIPDDSPDGLPEEGFKFRGHFLDLRTLAFALTDESYTLATACKAFGVEHGKQAVDRHGVVTPEYINYNRRDVLATAELTAKLLEEYNKHPISLQPTKAFSPASIGKAYLESMGNAPILKRQPEFPKKYLGFAQSAFFGGRTGAHIRKVPIPVVYTDFLSMYPTVINNMGLWRFVIANEIRVVEHCEQEMKDFLTNLSWTDLFSPSNWKGLTAFVQVIPDGDILPSRSRYSSTSNDWQVAINYLHSHEDRVRPLWFALPDVVVSVLLTGRIPKIVDAFKLAAHGQVKGLRPIRLRGSVDIDPRHEDFFKVAIEERKRLASRKDLPKSERDRLDKALKVIANSTSYGIYAEMNRQESDEKTEVICHGIDSTPFTCRVSHPEIPGRYCFPPLASLITSAARLKLALLEKSVSELGGTYAMEDTDSMAIVATEHGGLIPCPGGPYLLNDKPAIKALSWEQVEAIAKKFEPLNPYDRAAVRGSILKIEDDNFDPVTEKQRQLYCLATSAKRYMLLLKDRKGNPELLRKDVNNPKDRWSEHGLGHLLNPTNPSCEDKKWTGKVWEQMALKSLNLPSQELEFVDRPAVGRVTVSSPAIITPLARFNEDKPYPLQIKPFSFLLTCHVKPFGCPKDADPERFHLIAPYNSDPTEWLTIDWIDQYSGNSYRINTHGLHGTKTSARVKTYGDIIREYEVHPESKYADAHGNPCGKQTVGLLQRRHISIDHVKYIGKESNNLEAVDAGLAHSPEDVYTEYVDKNRDEWQTKILPVLQRLPLSHLISESGLSRRALLNVRAGRSRPHLKNQERLTAIVRSNEVGIE